ncbi:MAG: hypothetical protein M1823_005270 [Watsoniomyces obsoletus]|nr:MAG: hypothetical protein M1823_005270 [Watsoniomyces obsoletus]
MSRLYRALMKPALPPSESTKVVPLTCHGHSRPVTHLDFSAVVDDDQYYLISACKDNYPMLRDGITGDWIGTFVGHKGAVWQARLSSDAGLAVTGSADFTAKVWDTYTGETLNTLQHSHIVRAVAFPSQPRPTTLATGGAEKKLRVYDISRSAPAPTPATPNGSTTNGNSNHPTNDGSEPDAPSYEIGPGIHGGTIKSIVWGADPNILVTAADDKKIRWWDLRSRSVLGEFEVDGSVGSCEMNAVSSYALLENGNTEMTDNNNHIKNNSSGGILTVAAGKNVYFFDGMATRQLLKTIKTPYEVASAALHPERKQFVTGGAGDTWVRLYDYEDGKELELGKGHHGPIWSTSFSPDGKLYATGSEDGTIKLWKFCNVPYGLWR